MTTILKPAQIAILQATATAEGVAADKVDSRAATALVKKGFLISLPRTDAASLLLLTEAGRKAAGLPPSAASHAPVDTPPAASVAPKKPEAAAPVPPTKKATVRTMLERAEGATIEQICTATGWLPHSVRGIMAGALKKGGLNISSEKIAGVRVYRGVSAAQ